MTRYCRRWHIEFPRRPDGGALPVSLRPMRVLYPVLALALAVFAARIAFAADAPDHAGGFEPLAHGERERMLEQAQAQRLRAQGLRRESEETFRLSEAACYDRFMVSDCIADAKKARLGKSLEARKLDLDADRLERAVRLRESAKRETQREQSLPGREAADEAAARRNAELEQARATERAERDARREREQQGAPARAASEEAKRKKSADEAARRQAGEAKRAGERAAAAARQRADIDRRAALHAERRAKAEAAAAAKAASGMPAAR